MQFLPNETLIAAMPHGGSVTIHSRGTYADSLSCNFPGVACHSTCRGPDSTFDVLLPEFPKQIPNFDLTAIDKTADPCVDFYQYSCGNWMKNNPVATDKTRWGRFNELGEHNLYILRDILDQAQAPGTHSAIQPESSATTTRRAWTKAPSRRKVRRRLSRR